LNQDLEVSAQIPLPGCGPHDVLALDGDVLLVSCYESASLFRVFLPSETAEEVIDLQDYAGADGLPEMDALAADDRFIYLTLQNLDRQNNWLPEEPGKVLIFNRESLELENEVTLPCDDPYTQMAFADESSLVVGCAGTWTGGREGAGLAVLDTQTLNATMLYNSSELLGRPTHLDFIKDGVQLLVTATPSPTSAWDVETMQVLSLGGDEIQQVYSERGFSLGGVRAWAQDKVLIAQRTLDSTGGVLLLNTKTAEVEARWTTGLLPSHFMIAQ
ncbi:MAG: hypothetical protein HOI23_19410, partial [Deltaproteobacteria bacterium]|nr:hypothetical protein [Deltaproteobacteria bacterium]